MTEQANKVSFTYRSQFTNEPAEELAYELSTLCPGDLNWSFCREWFRSNGDCYENGDTALAGAGEDGKIISSQDG